MNLIPNPIEAGCIQEALMQKTDVLDRTKWDVFQLEVQEKLIEPLGLKNVIICVKRHDGINGNVKLNYPTHRRDSSARDTDHHGRLAARKQLTVDQLHEEIKTILDSLLENCAVQFGKIKFEVSHGELKETLFSFSARPHESTAEFFVL